jgi:hypothetical protein
MDYLNGLILEELMNRELSEKEISEITKYLFPKDCLPIFESDCIIFSPSAFAVKNRLTFLVDYFNKFPKKPVIFIRNGRKENYLTVENNQEREIVEDVYSRDFPGRNFFEDYKRGEGWLLKRPLIEEFGIDERYFRVSSEIETLDRFFDDNRSVFRANRSLLMPQPFEKRFLKRFLDLVGYDVAYHLMKTPFKDEKYGDASENEWWKSPASKSLVLAEFDLTRKRLENRILI